MRGRPRLLLVALLLSLVPPRAVTARTPTPVPTLAPAPAAERAPTPAEAAARVEALVAGWARALGGVEALRGITGIHQLGVVDGHGVSGDLDEWEMVDGRHRQYIDFQGRWSVLTVFDGTRGWSVDAERVRHVLRGEDLAGEYTDAWLAAFSWALPGRRAGTLEYGGVAAGGREERLVARPERGLPVTAVFDRAGGLPLRLETVSGGRTRVSAPLDWRPVGGVLFPFGYRLSAGDIRDDVSIVLREVRLNEPPPADAFAAPPGPPRDVQFAGDDGARLDVTAALGRLFLPVRLDGRGPYAFLLDTAAPRSSLSEALAAELGLAVVVDTAGVAAGEAPPAGRRFVTAGRLELADAAWSGARLELAPLDNLALSAGRRVDGRLGADFLQRFVVEYDRGHDRLVLHDPETFEPPRGGVAFPLRLVQGLPTLQVRLGGALRARLLLRTGMRFPLLLSAGLGPAFGLETGAPGTRQAPLATPAEGATLFTVGRVTRLAFPAPGLAPADEPALAAVPAAVLPPGEALPAGVDLQGMLGGEVLNRVDWILDLTREELRFEPRELDTAPFVEDAAGLAWRAEPPDFAAFTVDWILPGGPAAQAGLLPGDRLVSADGRPAAQWRLEELVALCGRPGETRRLVVQRGGANRKVQLRLGRLN